MRQRSPSSRSAWMSAIPAEPSHVANVFRKETGISPHQYRERTLGDVPMENFSTIATG